MFENMLFEIDNTLYALFQATYNNMSDAVAPVLIGAVTILIALYGLSVAFGRDLNFQEMMGLVVRITVVYMLVTGFFFFNSVIFLPITQTPGELAVVLASRSGATNINELIDAFIITGWQAIDVLQQNAGAFNVGAFALALIMMTATLLVGAVSFVVFALAKVVLALSLMLAPIFCAFLAFQSTRGWFESWLRMLFQAGLVIILAAGTMAVIMAMAENGLTQLGDATEDGEIRITDCVGYLTLAFITIILMPQLNNIAASLAAGGASLSYSGAGRLARQGRAAIGRSDHEKSRRRWEGPDGRPVTTAGSVLGAAAEKAGQGRAKVASWRNANAPPSGKGRDGPAPPLATPHQPAPKYSPLDTSPRAIMWRAEQDRLSDLRANARD